MYTLDVRDKMFVTVWVVWFALLLGAVEAIAFEYTERINLPLYWVIGILMVVVILSIIPWVTQERSDWLLVVSGAFLVQFFQDVGHWITRLVVLRNWNYGEPLWTPLWDVLGVVFPIPLFWMIDISIFVIFFIVWYEV
jgi:hypothetical protein